MDLTGLLRDVIEELEPSVRGRAVDWTVGALPVVRGDRTVLHLVLVILLSTALKFTRPRARADIEVGSLCQQSECIVFVRDNGVGFESCHADTVLDVFLRLHLREEFEGTGVGLASVRRIIDRHGGRTWTEGALDRGATTYFSCRRSMATHLGVGRRLEVGDGVHGEVVPDGGRGCGPY